MKALTRKQAVAQAVELGHKPKPWRRVNDVEESLRGFITNCKECWRDMVVVYTPERLTTGPIFEAQCDYVGALLGQRRLFP